MRWSSSNERSRRAVGSRCLTLRCEEHQQEDVSQFPGEIHRYIGAWRRSLRMKDYRDGKSLARNPLQTSVKALRSVQHFPLRSRAWRGWTRGALCRHEQLLFVPPSFLPPSPPSVPESLRPTPTHTHPLTLSPKGQTWRPDSQWLTGNKFGIMKWVFRYGCRTARGPSAEMSILTFHLMFLQDSHTLLFFLQYL